MRLEQHLAEARTAVGEWERNPTKETHSRLAERHGCAPNTFILLGMPMEKAHAMLEGLGFRKGKGSYVNDQTGVSLTPAVAPENQHDEYVKRMFANDFITMDREWNAAPVQDRPTIKAAFMERIRKAKAEHPVALMFHFNDQAAQRIGKEKFWSELNAHIARAKLAIGEYALAHKIPAVLQTGPHHADYLVVHEPNAA